MRIARQPLVLGTALVLVLGLTGLGILLAPSSSVAQSQGRGWMGVSLQDLNRSLLEALDLESDVEGAVVTDVVGGSPAENAGLRERDVIVEVEGKATRSVREVIDAVADHRPGDRITLQVLRDGLSRRVAVELGSFDSSPRERTRMEFAPRGDREPRVRIRNNPRVRIHTDDDADPDQRVIVIPDSKRRVIVRGKDGRNLWFGEGGHGEKAGYLGVQTQALTDQLADYFQVPGGRGVLVTEVVDGSPAAEAGLEAGDVLVRIDGQAVESHRDLRDHIRSRDAGDSVELTVIRRGSERSVKATLGESERGDALLELGGPGLHLGDLGPHERNLRRRGNRSFSIDIPEFHMELNREDMRELRRSMRELQEQLHEMLQDLHIEFEGEGRRWQERNDRQRARERLRRQLLQERDGDGL